ncbi:MAG: helix-turn-helix domain-containing protein [Vicinamibacteraceae bacterium]
MSSLHASKRFGMTDDTRLIRVLEQVYRPFEQPGDLVSAFVGALVDSASVQGAEVQLGANGHSVSVSRGWDAGVARQADRLPLTYGTRRLGELLLEADSSRASREERFGETARALSCLLQRYHARHYARVHLDSDLWLVGMAPSLYRLEDRIERIAQLPGPLLIQGEFGCETRAVAAAVHAASKSALLVEIRCSEVSGPAQLRITLDGRDGETSEITLLLSDVDQLDDRCQKVLVERLVGLQVARRCPPVARVPTGGSGPRVIASSSSNLEQLAAAGAFSKQLWSMLDFLRLDVPPLRDRREDIPHHVEYVTATFGDPPPLTYSSDAMAALVAYDWPGNLTELARTIGRLAAVKAGGMVSAADLREWSPELFANNHVDHVATNRTRGRPVRPEPSGLNGSNGLPPALDPVQLARDLLDGRLECRDHLHPGLGRALVYLARHSHEEVSLDQLAKESGVSASYLCALFKRALGLGFKRFQNILRIERAKHLLVRNGFQRVTEIALEVGFGDFSHFLKTFKRLTDVTPREYRKRHA